MKFLSRFFNLALVFSLSVFNLTGQLLTDSIQKNNRFVESEIPTEMNNLSDRLFYINSRLEKVDDIKLADSAVQKYFVRVVEERDRIGEEINIMSYRRLEKRIRAWKNYGSKLQAYQDRMIKRSEEIKLIKSELADDFARWEGFSQYILMNEVNPQVQQSVDTVLFTLSITWSEVNDLSDYIFIIQRKQMQLNRIIQNMILDMEDAQRKSSINYFVFDSKPIWNRDTRPTTIDLKSYFSVESDYNRDILVVYLKSNWSVLVFQGLFVLLFFGVFILLGKFWPVKALDKNSKREIQAGFIVKRPFFSSLIISLIISLFFYTNRPLVLTDLFIFLMLIASAVLLPLLLTRKLRSGLIILMVLFLITFFQDFIPFQSGLNRILLIIEDIIIIFLLVVVYRFKQYFELRKTGLKILIILYYVFISLTIVAILGNLIGMIRLGHFMTTAIAHQLYFSALIVTFVIILNSLMFLIIKGRHAQSIPLYEKLKRLIDLRIRPLIVWGAFFLWLYAALHNFMLIKPVNQILESFLGLKITISTVVISVGAVFSFALIIIVAFILVRFVKNIFRDDWVANINLPKGTADAVSMLIRYVIVVISIYLALISLGINLDKFGFIAGALGVGIGFGLQNIVLNFVAGLILAIERPIHIGDVIEVDTFMGRVTDIGVRASKIKTWDGSELIVPNGLLISNKVNNWTLTDEKRRLEIKISTSFDAEPEKVIEILSKVANEHPETKDQPVPFVLFDGYGSSSFDFTIYCWVEFSASLKTRSEIAVNAHKQLVAAGISVPVPLRRLQYEGSKKPL